MNYKDITIAIVTYKSEKVIFNCLKSIKKIKKIVINDNSNDLKLKNKVLKRYPHVKFIISKKNSGYGSGNNSIIKITKTPYVLVLSPDTILHKNCESELIKAINIKKNNFAIIAPYAKEKNYGFTRLNKKNNNKLIEVDFVKGFAMLFNKNKIKKIGMFDENFFLYLEEIDLCKRLRFIKEKIFVCKSSKIRHLGAKSSNIGFDYDKCRNWHWMWSQVYFDKKFNNSFYVYRKYSIKLIYNLIKAIIFILFFNRKNAAISYLRFSGIYNGLVGKKSWYRPVII